LDCRLHLSGTTTNSLGIRKWSDHSLPLGSTQADSRCGWVSITLPGQDPREAERTRDGLRRLDATSFSCRVVCAPLIPAVVDGRATFFYDVRLCREHFAWLGKAEFVFIDGPFSEGPCRYGTLSRVREHLVPGARFVMDDALREKELAAGALWAREGIVVDGVLTLGEGIMVGSVLPRLDQSTARFRPRGFYGPCRCR